MKIGNFAYGNRAFEGILSNKLIFNSRVAGESPVFIKIYAKAGNRTRTCDRLITNQLLYQLSYASTVSYTNRLSSKLQVFWKKKVQKLVLVSILGSLGREINHKTV